MQARACCPSSKPTRATSLIILELIQYKCPEVCGLHYVQICNVNNFLIKLEAICIKTCVFQYTWYNANTTTLVMEFFSNCVPSSETMFSLVQRILIFHSSKYTTGQDISNCRPCRNHNILMFEMWYWEHHRIHTKALGRCPELQIPKDVSYPAVSKRDFKVAPEQAPIFSSNTFMLAFMRVQYSIKAYVCILSILCYSHQIVNLNLKCFTRPFHLLSRTNTKTENDKNSKNNNNTRRNHHARNVAHTTCKHLKLPQAHNNQQQDE